jgi:ribulose-phosphate 3-epimerase
MGRVLIAPSILSADFTRLGEQIAEAEAAGADWIHVDIMDGHFVPNLSMGPVVVEACRRATQLPLDVHLMVERPERLISAFAKAGADLLTVHVESTPHVFRTLQAIKDLGVQAGVTLNPGTPIEALRPVLPLVDLVLVMCVNPGFSGQAFIEGALGKVSQVRAWLDEDGQRAHVMVDGGITARTAPRAVAAGADVLAVATAVFSHPQGIRAGIAEIRQALGATVPG